MKRYRFLYLFLCLATTVAGAALSPNPFYPFGAFQQTLRPLYHDPGVVTLAHVADANARLSIDPTGKVAGYQVIQDDDGLTYTFNGAGADGDAGLWVTGAGATSFNGPYLFSSSDTYSKIGSAETCISDHDIWSFGTEYVAGETETYAWQVLSWTIATTPPAPTVARNPITSETNWSHP